jgi:predicted amidohydrolase YtcJ
MNLLKILPIAAILFLISCESKTEVDLIVTNAKVYTVDDNFQIASAFAVKDGTFVAVGSDREILDAYSSAKSVNADQKPIYPGFIDAHCHFYSLGLNQQLVDLVGTKSFEEVLERVVDFYDGKNVSVIRGRGWDQNDWEVKKFPTKDRLDELFPDTPVALERVDGHAYLVNQKALDLAGITAQTKVSGGSVELEDGALTGVLVDTPMGLVDQVLPNPSLEEASEALKKAEQISFSYGLTTVDDAGLHRSTIELIDSLQQSGDLNIRIYAMVSNTKENLDYYLNKGIVETDKLYVGSVKVYADGALGSRGAALKQAYSDKAGHFGAMITTQEELMDLADRIAKSDYQMNTHAIGDSANVAVLRAYTKAVDDLRSRRWKVEHAQITSPIDFSYYKKGIIPSVQPTHATSDMYWAEERLGADRMPGAYPFKSLLDASGTLPLGTDFPVEFVNPFFTFYAAVTRQDQEGYPKGGFTPDQKLSREETLKGMTIWAAHSNFQEKERGSIETGKMADFVILDRDLMKVDPMEIPKSKVLNTYLGGEEVYRKN